MFRVCIYASMCECKKHHYPRHVFTIQIVFDNRNVSNSFEIIGYKFSMMKKVEKKILTHLQKKFNEL